jgi:toxin ParE1/3/4
MTVRILRRLKAAQDAEEIADSIAKDSLVAALRFLKNTESTLEDLATFPGAGSPFESDHPELANLRFRRVKGFPNHVIFYVEHTDAIEVVRILYGARDLDTELRRT